MAKLSARITEVENSPLEGYYYDDEDRGAYDETNENCEELDPVGTSEKRMATEPSRFQSMAKKFRSVEHVDVEVDSTLAENINDLFHNGIDEDRYEDLVKDESNARPENCTGLTVVKTNRLIWDAVSHTARMTDKKLQNIETSVVKAATIMTKMANEMAKLEGNVKQVSPFIDQGNKVLALLGHTNRQINMTRRDLLKPELRDDYSHLCNHSLPFTSELFGDDVGKQAKEIEDCNKIGYRIQRGGYSGSFRGRQGYRPRFRGRSRGAPMRGRNYSQSHTYGQSAVNQPKNQLRRGQPPRIQKQ